MRLKVINVNPESLNVVCGSLFCTYRPKKSARAAKPVRYL